MSVLLLLSSCTLSVNFHRAEIFQLILLMTDVGSHSVSPKKERISIYSIYLKSTKYIILSKFSF